MRIGIDFDGTIADAGNIKSAWIKETFGINIAPGKTNRTDCVPLFGEENYARMGNEVYERELTLKTKPNPDAVQFIHQLAVNRKLYLVTARSPRKMEFAKEWLDKYLVLHCFSGFESTKAKGTLRSKSSICNELSLDMMIDDDIRHLKEITSKNIAKILIRPDAEKVEESNGILIVRNWNDILKYVN